MNIEIITSTSHPAIPKGWNRAEEKYLIKPKNVDFRGKEIPEDFAGNRYKLVDIIQSPFSWTERFGRFFLGIFTAIFNLDFGFTSQRVQSLFHKKYKFIRYIKLKTPLENLLSDLSTFLSAKVTNKKMVRINTSLVENSQLFFNNKEAQDFLPLILNHTVRNLEYHSNICIQIIEQLMHLKTDPNNGHGRTLLTTLIKHAFYRQKVWFKIIHEQDAYVNAQLLATPNNRNLFLNKNTISNNLSLKVINLSKIVLTNYWPIISLIQKNGGITKKEERKKIIFPDSMFTNHTENISHQIFEQISKTVKIMNLNFLLTLHDENITFRSLPKDVNQLICDVMLDSLLNEIDMGAWLRVSFEEDRFMVEI